MISGTTTTTRSIRHIRLILLTLSAIALALSAAVPVTAQARPGQTAHTSIKPGAWTLLGAQQGLSTPTLLHLSSGNDLVVWMAPEASDEYHYSYVELKPFGGTASAPKDVFGGHNWSGLSFAPTLVSQNGRALLVLAGGRSANGKDPYSRGCIVGDLLSPGGWKLQTWSLSQSCVYAGNFGATITRKGTLSAAFPGGWANGNGILYRVGAAPTIPATTPDQHISTVVGDAGFAAEATDTGSQHVYAAWDRFFSKPTSKDGLWAADLTKKSPPLKAPGTGTNLVAHFLEPVAVASPSVRGGIYLAYCNNVDPCTHVQLWRYGAKKAVTVPKSSNPRSVSLSAGPSGRLWIAWWSATNGTVRVVRTNKAGNAFGPVETYAGPHGCQGDGNASIKVSSGSEQRLDVVMSCYDYKAAQGATHASATQSIVPLQIASSTGTINHKKGGSVTYRVADVGDAVPGAKVTVDGKQGVTDKKGQVTFKFAKGAHTGHFKVVASIANYLNASTFLHVS